MNGRAGRGHATSQAWESGSPVPQLAKAVLAALIVSLPLMKAGAPIGGYWVTATDALFLVALCLLTIAIARREASLRWSGIYPILIAYLAAMTLSTLVSSDPGRSAAKLLTQVYLLSLPLLTYHLVDNLRDLRFLMIGWLAGSAIPAAIGVATVGLFYLGVDDRLLDFALHPFGTLAPGHYPRLETSFIFPAMLCNYLTVSLGILLSCKLLGWIGPGWFRLLLAALLITALFTLTPGLGGLILALGLWTYLTRSRDRVRLFALFAGIGAALASVLIVTVTPILHPTAPFIIRVPWLGLELAPGVRWMTWTDAAASFARHPLFGSGIGSPEISVRYMDPSGILHVLSDAHNVFLNIAAQCGLIGLISLLLLIAWVIRRTAPLRIDGNTALRVALGLAWLNAFAIQGLTASFEDARHLWVLLGLFLAAIRLENSAASQGPLHQGSAARSGETKSLRASTENSRSRL